MNWLYVFLRIHKVEFDLLGVYRKWLEICEENMRTTKKAFPFSFTCVTQQGKLKTIICCPIFLAIK